MGKSSTDIGLACRQQWRQYDEDECDDGAGVGAMKNGSVLLDQVVLEGRVLVLLRSSADGTRGRQEDSLQLQRLNELRSDVPPVELRAF